MKTVTRKSLDELARIMPVISEENQKMYVGGTSGYTGGNPPTGTTGSSDGGWTPPAPVSAPLGSPSNPYSIDEALGLMDAGHWGGGYVSGWGYVSPEVQVDAPPTGSNPPTGYVDDYFNSDDGTTGNYLGGYGDGYLGGYVGGYGGGGTIGGGGSGGGSVVGGSDSDNSSSVSPGVTGNCLGNNGSLYDGVNIQNTKNFTFNTEAYSQFNEQLTSVLRSNSVLKSLLGYFDKGCVHLTFSIEELDKQITAYTTWKTYESYHIVFNSQYMTEQGWNVPLNRIDNIGYDWSKVKTFDEALLVTLTHEAIHAKHFAVFHDACIQAGNNVEKTARILKEKGYSQEFIDIFIDKSTNKDWVGNE